jgi:chorismate synthase
VIWTAPPGQSKFVTQRQEADQVKILSGVIEDTIATGPVTTGTPIALMIENTDQRSKDYGEIASDKFVPATPTSPMRPNTACATIAAAAAPRRARPPRASPPARWRASSSCPA